MSVMGLHWCTENKYIYIYIWAGSIVRGNENSWRWRHCITETGNQLEREYFCSKSLPSYLHIWKVATKTEYVWLLHLRLLELLSSPVFLNEYNKHPFANGLHVPLVRDYVSSLFLLTNPAIFLTPEGDCLINLHKKKNCVQSGIGLCLHW